MAAVGVIRDMGDTLVQLLRAATVGVVDPANIRLSSPERFSDVGVNPPLTITIFLYRIEVNAAARNGPRRSVAGGLTTRPLLPLDLHYLITPWAREPADECTLAGHILQSLYDRAELGTADLQGTSWDAGDSVQLVLESLPTEEHYRIWETANMPYRLSLTYLARVIGIEPREQLAVPPVVEALFTGAPV